MRTIQRLIGFIALSLLALVLGTDAQDEKMGDIIKVATRLVGVPVIVSDRNGRYVPNLTEADFSVFQDGSLQKIEFFAATEEPLTIALLIDTSQSTRPVLGDIKDSAKSLIGLLSPNDRAMIVTFDYETRVLSPLTSVKENLKDAVKRAEIPDRRFGTTLRDAAFQTVNRSFAGISGRKAIIILTDGKDVGSQILPQELLFSLQESDTLIYTIMFKTDNHLPGRQRGGSVFGGRFPRQQSKSESRQRIERIDRNNEGAEEFLQEMSFVTAGRFYSSKNGKLKATFASIIEELRFQYSLGFYPPEENGVNTLHELKIKVARADTIVRTRSSYRSQGKIN